MSTVIKSKSQKSSRIPHVILGGLAVTSAAAGLGLIYGKRAFTPKSGVNEQNKKSIRVLVEGHQSLIELPEVVKRRSERKFPALTIVMPECATLMTMMPRPLNTIDLSEFTTIPGTRNKRIDASAAFLNAKNYLQDNYKDILNAAIDLPATVISRSDIADYIDKAFRQDLTRNCLENAAGAKMVFELVEELQNCEDHSNDELVSKAITYLSQCSGSTKTLELVGGCIAWENGMMDFDMNEVENPQLIDRIHARSQTDLDSKKVLDAFIVLLKALKGISMPYSYDTARVAVFLATLSEEEKKKLKNTRMFSMNAKDPFEAILKALDQYFKSVQADRVSSSSEDDSEKLSGRLRFSFFRIHSQFKPLVFAMAQKRLKLHGRYSHSISRDQGKISTRQVENLYKKDESLVKKLLDQMSSSFDLGGNVLSVESSEFTGQTAQRHDRCVLC